MANHSLLSMFNFEMLAKMVFRPSANVDPKFSDSICVKLILMRKTNAEDKHGDGSLNSSLMRMSKMNLDISSS